jgi:hypothetical protein
MTILLPHSHFATTYISPISSNFTLAARVPCHLPCFDNLLLSIP